MTFNIDSEKKFWAWLRDKLVGHVIRIENSVGHGIPDVNVCHDGKEMWVELKCGHEVVLRTAQYAWGMRRAKHGGHVFVINYCPVHDMVGLYRYPLSVVKRGKYVKVTSFPEWRYSKDSITKVIF